MGSFSEFIFRGGFPSKLMQHFGMLQKSKRSIDMLELPMPNTVFRLVPTCPACNNMSSCHPGNMHPCGTGFGGPMLQAAHRFFFFKLGWWVWTLRKRVSTSKTNGAWDAAVVELEWSLFWGFKPSWSWSFNNSMESFDFPSSGVKRDWAKGFREYSHLIRWRFQIFLFSSLLGEVIQFD